MAGKCFGEEGRIAGDTREIRGDLGSWEDSRGSGLIPEIAEKLAGTRWREGGERHHRGGKIAGILKKPQEGGFDETVVRGVIFPREGEKERKEGELFLVCFCEGVGFPREGECV